MSTSEPVVEKKDERWMENVTPRAEAAARFAAFEKGLSTKECFRLYWRAILWIFYGHLNIFGYGIDGVVAGALASTPKFREDYGVPFDTGSDVSHIIPANWLSIWAGVSQIIAVAGGLFVGYFADKIGRKWTNALCAAVSVGGVAAQYASYGSMTIITVGKAINGFSIGAWVVLMPLYASEVAPLRLRGWLTAVTNFFLFCGLLAFNGVIYELGPMDNVIAYRVPLALQWVVPGMVLLTVWFWPESPVHLIRSGDHEGAMKAIRKLYGPDGPIDHAGLCAQIEETIEHELNGGKDQRSYLECFAKGNRLRTFITIFSFTALQASGGIFIMGYQSYYYQLIGYSTERSFLLTMLCNLVMFIATIMTWFLIDRVGRRKLFVWGEFITACCLFVVGGCSVKATIAAYKAAIAFIFLWSFVFQLTVGTIGFTIFSEVPSMRLRARTQALANITLSIVQWVIGFTFPYLFNPDAANLGGQVGFIYGGITFIFFGLGFWYLPETQGRTVAELDILFEKKVPPRNFYKTGVTMEDDGTIALVKRRTAAH